MPGWSIAPKTRPIFAATGVSPKVLSKAVKKRTAKRNIQKSQYVERVFLDSKISWATTPKKGVLST
jgi:hypothetical protein